MSEEGIRPGEIAVTLPEDFDDGVYFIGRIHTPWTRRDECPKNARGSDAVCTIALDARYAAALDGVASCTHLVILYFLDRAGRRGVGIGAAGHGSGRAPSAFRSRVRPTPIAMTVVKLLAVEGTTLSVVG